LSCRLPIPRPIPLFLSLILPLHSEIIDRIAASVDNRVITQSEVDRQIRVTAFQDGIPPDLSAKHKQAVLQTMIDQKLIQRDLEDSHYPLPDPAELNPAIAQFKKDHFPSEAEYLRTLAQYGITDQDFRDLLLWQRTLLSFIEMRFASTDPLTDQEISDYFEKSVKPAAQAARPGQPVTLDEYRGQIEKKLEADRSDRQLYTWLKAARRRAQIVVHEEALR
jgi:hypothetical protein